ncbi:MAG: SAM-dependent methyltransferase [Candidatus Altiarchaeota archaeon]
MISVVYDVVAYRNLLAKTVREADTVVEIGPHVGRSTDTYLAKAGRAILIDKGKDCVKALSEIAEKHDNVVYVCGDARGFDTLSLVRKHAPRCDVLAVDLGGGRFPDTVFKVWATWSGVLQPRHSIIRCSGLAEFIRRAKVQDDTLPKEFADNGWLSEYGRAIPSKMKVQLEEFSHWVDINRRDYANHEGEYAAEKR